MFVSTPQRNAPERTRRYRRGSNLDWYAAVSGSGGTPQGRRDRRAMAQPSATPASATRPPAVKADAIAHDSDGGRAPAGTVTGAGAGIFASGAGERTGAA